jgi:hypothetical protein
MSGSASERVAVVTEIGERRRPSAVGHVDHVDARHHHQQLSRHMCASPVADRCHVEFARIGLGVVDELRDRLGGYRRMNQHGIRLTDEARDGRDVLDEIEAELIPERRVNRVRCCDEKQRMAISRRPNDRLGPSILASPRPIPDDEGLTEPLRQPLSHQARKDVGRAAGS